MICFTKNSYFVSIAVKEILPKDVKNLVSKQIFARWQSILSAFDFDLEFIKGEKQFSS